MSQIIYPITHLPPVIDIGKQTEKGVTRIGFDVHEWLDDWPGMAFSVQPTRPGETESYFAASEMVGSVVFWMVGAVDTEKPGSGTVEVLGVTEDERKLSFMCRTSIANTNTATVAEVPEPNQPWVDQVVLAGEGAKESAKEAKQSATTASQAASAAGQYSANADAQAASAAKSAANAAQSATESYQSFRSASGAASTAVQSATEAAKAQANAEGHAAIAGNKAQEAENSAADAATSAENAKKAAESVKDFFIVKTPFILNTNPQKTDKTQAEIIEAIEAGKVCMLVATLYNRVYDSASIEDGAPVFRRYGFDNKTNKSFAETVTVNADDTVTSFYTEPILTPNPGVLHFRGAVKASYNGGKHVTVEIPSSGLPETADPLKQLVTDKDGKVAWEDRLAYKTTAEVVNLAPTELTAGDDGGDGTNESFFLLSPWAVELVAGSVATVTYNGTVYECAAVDYSQFESGAPAGAVALGNMNALGAIDIEGSNPDAPFVLMALPNAWAADMGGMCGMFVPLDGAASVTIAVSSVVATYKTIDPEYLPKQNQDDNTVILTIDQTTAMQPSHSHDEAWALAQAGKHLILHAITSDGGYSLPMTEYKVNGDQRDIYFTVIDSERTLIRWTYGVNGFRIHSEKL